MTVNKLVVLEITRLEAAHLSGLLTQFADLLADETAASAESTSRDGAPPADPAIARLVPDAYADDRDASREFRGLTERELLDRRASDVRAVLASLSIDGEKLDPAELKGDVTDVTAVTLDDASVRAWLRTLTALRLVLASRLGIHSEADHDDGDPRFGVYDWLGYRLDGLVRAVEAP